MTISWLAVLLRSACSCSLLAIALLCASLRGCRPWPGLLGAVALLATAIGLVLLAIGLLAVGLLLLLLALRRIVSLVLAIALRLLGLLLSIAPALGRLVAWLALQRGKTTAAATQVRSSHCTTALPALQHATAA